MKLVKVYSVRNRYRSLALLALCFVMVLAACDTPSGDGAQSGPTAPPSQSDAIQTAQNFLDAWDRNDYAAMYALLSPKSLIIDPEAFANTYKDVEQKLKLTEKGKSFEINQDQTVRQGNTVAVRYNMTFNSGPLGSFTDENRTIRLVLAQGKWRVAWSTMDIFEGMAGGATLSVALTQATRGTIFDRNGQVIAKDNIPNYAVRLITRKYPTGKPADCFNALAEVFRLRAADLDKSYGEFTDKDYGFTIGTLSQEDYQRLRPQLDAVCFLEYRPQTSRFYYSGSFAAQTVGFMGRIPSEKLGDYPGYSPDSLVGRIGVEQAWEPQLAGVSGAQLVITTPDGIRVRSVTDKAPGASQDVTLTLDRDLQVSTERALASAVSTANWGQFSTGAAAVVLDVKTGEVLAIASYPTISPDAYLPSTSFDDVIRVVYDQKRAQFNRATQELYAAGSVFKIISTAAAVESKAFKLSDVYVCTGLWDGSKRGDTVRKDWIYLDKYAEKKYHDALTLQQGLTASCDTYFWEVGAKLDGIDATLLRRYANQMGVGVKTGIDVIAEETGNIPDPNWKFNTQGKAWGIGDSLNTVIGQGDVQVTPLQIARMMMGVANGGTLYHPHLVKSVGVAGQNPTYSATALPTDQSGLAPQTIKGIQDALCAVTTDTKIGTAQFVFYNWDSSQVKVCGKTGTAQTGSAYPNGWFAAFAGKPGQPPEIAIAVLVERSREGSETAGPIVRRIVESYYHIPQEPWPEFWTYPYEVMEDPGASDGGGPRIRNK